MNTSFNWRAHTSNLLSTEFLQLARKHLKPGGVHYYNGTSAGEAYITGAMVFPYAVRIENCLAVSDSPIRLDRERWRNVLANYRIDGKPVLDLSRPDQRQKLESLLSTLDPNPQKFQAVEYADSIRQRFRNRRPITDDNMGTEWLPWWLRPIDLPPPDAQLDPAHPWQGLP
ncbi:MAG: hypothetical protein LAQ30_26935 [Acidobacteriia bacterium]|nr:hypothetical protein [Terriglobia bacterium]